MKAKRSISRTSFILKGSGWYTTDYGGANASNRPSTTPAATSEGGTTPAATSEGAKSSTSESKSSKKAANE